MRSAACKRALTPYEQCRQPVHSRGADGGSSIDRLGDCDRPAAHVARRTCIGYALLSKRGCPFTEARACLHNKTSRQSRRSYTKIRAVIRFSGQIALVREKGECLRRACARAGRASVRRGDRADCVGAPCIRCTSCAEGGCSGNPGVRHRRRSAICRRDGFDSESGVVRRRTPFDGLRGYWGIC